MNADVSASAASRRRRRSYILSGLANILGIWTLAGVLFLLVFSHLGLDEQMTFGLLMAPLVSTLWLGRARRP